VKKIAFVFAILIALWAQNVWADTMSAVSKRPLKDKADLIKTILTGDEGDPLVYNIPISTLIDRLNKVHGLRLENRGDLVKLIESGDIASCGTGKAAFDRVRKSDKEFGKPWVRSIHPGEQCLYMGERSILSLHCVNPTPKIRRSGGYTTNVSVDVAGEYQPEPASAMFIPTPDPSGLTQARPVVWQSPAIRKDAKWYSPRRIGGQLLIGGAAGLATVAAVRSLKSVNTNTSSATVNVYR